MCVATDDARIAEHVESFGGAVILTASNHPSGTDRCAEAARLLNYETGVIINVQGDEPFVQPEQIDELAAVFDQQPAAQIATLIKLITSATDLFDSSKPKVVVDAAGKALYFSRQTIPFLRNFPPDEWLNHHSFYRHVGMYGYRAEVLQQLVTHPVGTLEQAELLEQLRWLEQGFSIYTHLTTYETLSVDTPEDLHLAEAMAAGFDSRSL